MRRTASLVVLASTLSLLPALPARAGEPTPLPPDTILDIRGHGWGHGRGMGQWGAKGMADEGNTYTEILDHYYAAGEATAGADTPLVRYGQRGNPIIRVLVESSQDVIVTSRQPFTIRPHGATELSWRSTDAEPFWRITYAGGKYRYARAASWNPASWETVATDTRYADFVAGDASLELVRNGGSVRRYRGTLTARWSLSDGMRAINNVPVEDYLRGVVPRESPSSWPAAALRAQSVAARTYAHRYRDASREGDNNTFDICATTSCQVYEGSGSRDAPGATLITHEVDSTDAAIAATAGEVLLHASEPILAEFSSSTGGYTAPGSVPYQIAVPDPGDRVSPHHLWSASIRVTDVESQWPAIGRLVRVDVTDRNGYGDWGGRVRQLRIVGTRSSVSISGDAFRSAFAWPSGGQVRSSWFTIGIIRAERATVPTTVSVPSGGSKRVAMRFRNVGTDPWFVGGELQLETDAPSPFRHEAWISNEVVARISDNATRPGASLIDPGEVAEFIVVIDAGDAAPGSQTMPLRLRPVAGRVIDQLSLDVQVLESWIDAAPNMLTSGSFEKQLAGWTVARGNLKLLGGRDSTPGVVSDGDGLLVLEQTIDLAGGTGRRFLLGGWAKHRGAEISGSVLLTYSNGSSERHRLDGWSGDWRYAQRSFRTSATQQLDRMRLRLVADVAEGGRAEFDAFRLVEDPIPDPSFEASSLDAWTITAPADLPRPSRIDWAATDGRVALRVPGRAGSVTLEQRFELDARAWDRLTLRFSERVYGATAGSDTWRVSLILEHADGSETTGSIALDTLQHPWRDASFELRPAVDVHHARLRIEGTNPTGRADLDAFRLLRSRHADPSFETSDAWSSGNLGGDDGFDESAARDGSRGLRLEGAEEASSSQRFQLGGTRHRILRLSVMDVVSGRIRRGDRIEIAVTFVHRDGSRNTRRLPLGVRAHPWTFREVLVSSTEAFDEVRLTVSSRGHDGMVFVDQLLLTDA